MTSRRSCSAWWALSRITSAARGDVLGGASGLYSSAPGVHAQQRQPVAEHVVHLPGYLLTGVVLSLLGAQARLGLGAGRAVRSDSMSRRRWWMNRPQPTTAPWIATPSRNSRRGARPGRDAA